MGAYHSLGGARIRQARLAAGLRQAQLAAAMGVTQQMVSSWERDVSRPRDRSRTRLARILGTTVEELFPYLPDDTDGDEAAA